MVHRNRIVGHHGTRGGRNSTRGRHDSTRRGKDGHKSGHGGTSSSMIHRSGKQVRYIVIAHFYTVLIGIY